MLRKDERKSQAEGFVFFERFFQDDIQNARDVKSSKSYLLTPLFSTYLGFQKGQILAMR